MATKIVISDRPPYFLDLDAPTLRAYEATADGVRVWRVWCADCDEWHERGPGEGHRECHCTVPGSRYYEHGYNLALGGPWEG